MRSPYAAPLLCADISPCIDSRRHSCAHRRPRNSEYAHAHAHVHTQARDKIKIKQIKSVSVIAAIEIR